MGRDLFTRLLNDTLIPWLKLFSITLLMSLRSILSVHSHISITWIIKLLWQCNFTFPFVVLPLAFIDRSIRVSHDSITFEFSHKELPWESVAWTGPVLESMTCNLTVFELPFIKTPISHQQFAVAMLFTCVPLALILEKLVFILVDAIT